jgi:tRNA pseudouridine38-40 synthase
LQKKKEVSLFSKNFKITISYNGSSYFGWQRQKNQVSVQGTVEECLEKIFGQKIPVTGCGRTDSGTHALSCTANFRITTRLSAETVGQALNANLPATIRVRESVEVSPEFHSRFDARSKTYRYLIADRPCPFLRDTALYVPQPLNLPAMKKAAGFLKGTHNFTSFQSAGSAVRNPVRRITGISFRGQRCTLDPDVHILAIEIEASGFLYKMARNIIGTLLKVGKGELRPVEVKKILQAQDRTKAPAPVPASGLYLKEVKYSIDNY